MIAHNMYYAQFLRGFGELVLTNLTTYFSKITRNIGFCVFAYFRPFGLQYSGEEFWDDANKRILSGSVLQDDEIPWASCVRGFTAFCEGGIFGTSEKKFAFCNFPRSCVVCSVGFLPVQVLWNLLLFPEIFLSWQNCQ